MPGPFDDGSTIAWAGFGVLLWIGKVRTLKTVSAPAENSIALEKSGSIAALIAEFEGGKFNLTLA